MNLRELTTQSAPCRGEHFIHTNGLVARTLSENREPTTEKPFWPDFPFITASILGQAPRLFLFLLACYIPIVMGADINESGPAMRLEGFHTFTATPNSAGAEISWVVDKAVNGKVSQGVFTAIGNEASFDLDWDRGNTTYTIKANDNGFEDKVKVQVFRPGQEVKYQFQNPYRDSPSVTVRVLVPSSLNPDTPLISVHHGSSRTNYFDYWKKWGEQAGWIIIAPHFPDSEPWRGSRGYNLGNMFTEREGAGKLIPEEKWSYRIAVDFAVSFLEGFELNDQTFDMWGHSAGGQFTHRTMLFVRDAPIRRGLPANPGWWTLPVYDQFDKNFKYPYGLYHPLLDYNEQDILRFTKMYGIINAGNLDTSRENSLRTTREADAQGKNRWLRANNMFTSIGASNSEHNWEFFKVDGIGHDGQMMAKAAQAWLENNPPVPSGLTITRVAATVITDASAVISWKTSAPADTSINYGLSTNYGLNTMDPVLLRSHSITLTGLQPATQYHYQVISSDETGSIATSEDFTFTTLDTTSPGNLPPVANAGSNQTVNEGAIVTLAGSGSDPDGSIAAYQWTQVSGPTVTLTNPSTATARFTAPAAATQLIFKLVVTDNGGLTANDKVTIKVGAPTTGKGADLIVDKLVYKGMKRGSGRVGKKLKVIAKVLNSGSKRARNSKLMWALSIDPVIDTTDLQLGKLRNVRTLTGGSMRLLKGTFRIPTSVVPGMYYLVAMVDSTNTVAESNEANNTAAVKIEIKPKKGKIDDD